MKESSHNLDDVQTAVLSVALTNKSPNSSSYEEYKQNLADQLKKNGNQIIKEPIAFYKKGVQSPAGYVIETNNEVLVCYHGTQFGKILGSGGNELVNDLRVASSSMDFGDKTVAIHSGFKNEFEQSKDSMYQALSQTDVKNKSVHLAGHSLGGAVSQIAAMDLSTHFDVKVGKVTTFGSPKVFQREAANLYNSKGLGDVTLRIAQDKDPVPKAKMPGTYQHVGEKIILSSQKKGRHSGGIYRDIAKNMTEEDIKKKVKSGVARTVHERLTEDYIDPIMNMTKQTFMKLYIKSQEVFDKIKNQFILSSDQKSSRVVQNKERRNLDSRLAR